MERLGGAARWSVSAAGSVERLSGAAPLSHSTRQRARWRVTGYIGSGLHHCPPAVEVQSVLQIDVEVEEPETSENPTQSFEIHYMFQRP